MIKRRKNMITINKIELPKIKRNVTPSVPRKEGDSGKITRSKPSSSSLREEIPAKMSKSCVVTEILNQTSDKGNGAFDEGEVLYMTVKSRDEQYKMHYHDELITPLDKTKVSFSQLFI